MKKACACFGDRMLLVSAFPVSRPLKAVVLLFRDFSRGSYCVGVPASFNNISAFSLRKLLLEQGFLIS
jgi:hypothetical protein